MDYYYNNTTTQRNTKYYNMNDDEYKRLTSHKNLEKDIKNILKSKKAFICELISLEISNWCILFVYPHEI